MDYLDEIQLSSYKRRYSDPESLYRLFSESMRETVDEYREDYDRWTLEVYRMQDFADTFMSEPPEAA